MTARSISLQTSGWPMAVTALAFVVSIALAVGALAEVATPDVVSEPPGPALGMADDYGTRIAAGRGARLGAADDFGTRHAAGVAVDEFTAADDFGTRHGAEPAPVLSEDDDYGTRGSRATRFGPPGR